MISSLRLVLVRLFLLCIAARTTNSTCSMKMTIGGNGFPYPGQTLSDLTGQSYDTNYKFRFHGAGKHDARIRMSSDGTWGSDDASWLLLDIGAGLDTYSYLDIRTPGDGLMGRLRFNTYDLIKADRVETFTLVKQDDVLRVHVKDNFHPIIYFKDKLVKDLKFFTFSSWGDSAVYWAWGTGCGEDYEISENPNNQQFSLLVKDSFTAAYYLPDWRANTKQDDRIVFKFSVSAKKNAYFRLSATRDQRNPKEPDGIEVIMGQDNARTVVKQYTSDGTNKYSSDSPDLLSSDEMRPFTLLLDADTLSLYAGDSTDPFLVYSDDFVTELNYISFAGPAAWSFTGEEDNNPFPPAVIPAGNASDDCPTLLNTLLDFYLAQDCSLSDN